MRYYLLLLPSMVVLDLKTDSSTVKKKKSAISVLRNELQFLLNNFWPLIQSLVIIKKEINYYAFQLIRKINNDSLGY